MMRFHNTPFIDWIRPVLSSVLIVLFSTFGVSCSGGGGSGGGGSGGGGSGVSSTGGASTQTSPAIKLADIDGGGAWHDFSLFNGRLYFTNSNLDRTLHSISVNGGELRTHYLGGASGVTVVNNRGIFLLQTQTNGAVQSHTINSEGISVISRLKQNWFGSVAADDTYVYWTEFQTGSGRLVRAPLQVMGVRSNYVLQGGYSTDELLPFPLVGRGVLALDGNSLFVLDIGDGTGTVPIYKIDLTTGAYTLHTSVSSRFATSWNALYGFEMLVNKHFLYVYDGLDVIQVDKTSGASSVAVAAVPFTGILGRHLRVDTNALYWCQSIPFVSSYNLMRLDSSTGVVSNLATNPSLDRVIEFGSDGADLWWFTYKNSPMDITISKVPTSGGTVQLMWTFPFPDMTHSVAESMFFDSSNIYWRAGSGIYQMTKLGGAPSLLTSGWTGSTVENTTHFVSGSGLGIRKVPKAGQQPPIDVWQIANGSVSTFPRDLTAQNGVLYWTSTKTTYNPVVQTAEIYSYDGYTTALLGSTPGFAHKIVSDNSGIITAYYDASGYKIAAMPLGGGAYVDLILSADQVLDLELFNGVLYFVVSDNWSYSKLFSFDLNTSALTEMETYSGLTGSNLYVDGNHIYWSYDSGIFRLPIGGGAKENIYNGWSAAITGDASNIYWLTGFSVMKKAK